VSGLPLLAARRTAVHDQPRVVQAAARIWGGFWFLTTELPRLYSCAEEAVKNLFIEIVSLRLVIGDALC